MDTVDVVMEPGNLLTGLMFSTTYNNWFPFVQYVQKNHTE